MSEPNDAPRGYRDRKALADILAFAVTAHTEASAAMQHASRALSAAATVEELARAQIARWGLEEVLSE